MLMTETIVDPRPWAGPGGWPALGEGWTSLLLRTVRASGMLAGRLVGFRRDARGAEETPSFEASALPHLDGAYNLARYLCRDGDAAQDIVQEAFLRAYRAWPEFRGGSVRAWLFAIVRNCHFSWREQRRSQARTSGAATPDPEGEDSDPLAAIAAEGDPERDLLRSDEAACVRRALDGLADDMREVLVLRDLEDCSYREIAEVLGLPMGTVMSRLSRARRAFAVLWSRDMGEDAHG